MSGVSHLDRRVESNQENYSLWAGLYTFTIMSTSVTTDNRESGTLGLVYRVVSDDIQKENVVADDS